MRRRSTMVLLLVASACGLIRAQAASPHGVRLRRQPPISGNLGRARAEFESFMRDAPSIASTRCQSG